jgi:hypothetical protein
MHRAGKPRASAICHVLSSGLTNVDGSCHVYCTRVADSDRLGEEIGWQLTRSLMCKEGSGAGVASVRIRGGIPCIGCLFLELSKRALDECVSGFVTSISH